MEYPPKKVRIQHLKTGKISEITVVAVEVMKKHGLFKEYEVINPDMPVREITAKKLKKTKEIAPKVLMVEDLPPSDQMSVTDETPNTPETNQNIIE